jgi:hypothetical protein
MRRIPFVETSPKLVLANLGGKGASEVVAAPTVTGNTPDDIAP